MLRLVLAGLVIGVLLVFVSPPIIESLRSHVAPPAEKAKRPMPAPPTTSGVPHATLRVKEPKPDEAAPERELAYQKATKPETRDLKKRQAAEPERKRFFRVVVEDAGTLKSGKTTIRLAGLDAPALEETCPDTSGERWPCGRRGRAALARLIRSKAVDCAIAAREESGVAVARCKVGRVDVNAWVVRHGWARTSDAAAKRYAEALDKAKKDGRGIWRK
ncbi:MAG: thermonuclease family protein [Methyloligellaceae bacterium]